MAISSYQGVIDVILRKDAWTHAEDEIIVENILAFAREGRTQKDAVEYILSQLPNRTKAAIRLRWNNFLKGRTLRRVQQETDAQVQEETHVESVVQYVSVDTMIEMIDRIMNMPNLDATTISLMNNKLRNIVKQLSPLSKV